MTTQTIPSSVDYAQEFTSFFNELADESGKIALRYFRNTFSMDDKEDKSPVTQADKEIETVLRKMICNRFPEHGIIGEEYGAENASAEFVWVIDPIDGTKAFATGKPLFGTIIGLVHQNRPVVGLIDQPFTQERWFGISNSFSTHNGKKIEVAHPRQLDQSRLYTTTPEMFEGKYSENFLNLAKKAKWTLYGCDCYAYGLVAMGHADVVIEQCLGLHDVIGLIPIIKGAGGYASDWSGKEVGLDFNGQFIVASHKDLAHEALAMINNGMPR